MIEQASASADIRTQVPAPYQAEPRGPDVRPRSWKGTLAAGAILFCLTLAGHIYSGRIQPIPSMDDATYFRDAIELVNQFHGQGPGGVALWILNHPPHSLYSALLAFFAYILFGVTDWAPYAGNAVTLVLYLFLIRQATSRLRENWVVLVEGTFLTLPIASMTISEFRPDFACGLWIAIAVQRLAQMAEEREISSRQCYWTGVIGGLAILTKPSFMPYVAVVFLLAAAVSVFCLRRETVMPYNFGRPGSVLPGRAHLFVKLAVAFVLVSMVDFALKGSREINYILDNVFGRHRHIWVLPLDLFQHATYHLFGDSGKFLLGPPGFGLLALSVLPLIVPPLIRIAGRRYAVLLAATLASYVIAAAVAIKSPYSGSVFAAMAAGLSAYVLSILGKPFHGRAGWVAGSLLLTAFAIFFRPSPNGQASWKLSMTQAPIVESAMKVIEDESRRTLHDAPHRTIRAMITTYGYLVNRDAIEFLCLKRGLRNVEFLDLHRTTDLAEFRQAIAVADVVLAGAGTGDDNLPWLPANGIAAQTMQIVRADKRLKEIVAPLTSADGSEFHLFVRQPPWQGISLVSGLGPIEGPYLPQGLSLYFWAHDRATSAVASPAYEGLKPWQFRARSPIAGQKMTVVQGGKSLATFAFPAPNVDVDGTFLAGGLETVSFQFAETVGPSKIDKRKLALLFSRMDVIEPER